VGIAFFAPPAVSGSREGEDFLETQYTSAHDVAAHVNACTISGFCIGSPGTYLVAVFGGAPASAVVALAQFKVRLVLRHGRGACLVF
jgi:hypothetical protein